MAPTPSDIPGPDLDALRALALAELPPVEPEALRRSDGTALRIHLSADPSGLSGFRAAAAEGRAPRAVMGIGPESALDAFGATAHHLGAPALGFDLRPERGSALLASEDDPSPGLRRRCETWEVPPIPSRVEGAPEPGDSGPEAELRRRVHRARAARGREAARRLDGTLGGRTRFTTAEAEAGLLEDGPALALEVAEAGGDPFWAAAAAVARAARRLACVGAEPLGLVLRLGIAGGEDRDKDGAHLEQVCMGVRQACLSLGLPLAEATVGRGGPALLVAAAGLLDGSPGPVDPEAPDAKGLAWAGPRCAGRRARKVLDGLHLLGGGDGDLPLDLDLRLQACVREGVRLGLLRSAAVVGPGGVAGEAAEVAGPLGVQLFLPGGADLDPEAPGRVLATTGGEGESALRTLCATHRVPLLKVGVIGGGRVALALDGDPVADLEP